MRWNQLDDVRSALDTAIIGRLCVQAWLGVGQVLFLGLGEEIIPTTAPGERHPRPEYELQIDFADWWVEDASGVLGASEPGRDAAEPAAALLVGHRAVGWKFTNPLAALEIDFEGGLMLKMAPYAEADVAEDTEDAWVLRVPVYYGYMKWDGTFGVGRRDDHFLDSDQS